MRWMNLVVVVVDLQLVVVMIPVMIFVLRILMTTILLVEQSGPRHVGLSGMRRACNGSVLCQNTARPPQYIHAYQRAGASGRFPRDSQSNSLVMPTSGSLGWARHKAAGHHWLITCPSWHQGRGRRPANACRRRTCPGTQLCRAHGWPWPGQSVCVSECERNMFACVCERERLREKFGNGQKSNALGLQSPPVSSSPPLSRFPRRLTYSPSTS